MVKFLIFTLLSLFAILDAAKLPTYLTQCKLSDPNLNGCIKKNSNKAIPDVAKGDIHYDIPSALPLRFLEPIVSTDNNQDIVVTDLQIHGLESAKISDIKFELEKGTYKLTLEVPTITALASCHALGNYFGYAVSNQEFLNEKFIDTNINFNFTFSQEETDGETYITILDHSGKLRSREQFNEFFRGFGPLRVHKTVCQERFPQIIEKQIGEYLFTITSGLTARLSMNEGFLP